MFDEPIRVRFDLGASEIRIPWRIYEHYKRVGVDSRAIAIAHWNQIPRKVLKFIDPEIHFHLFNSKKLSLRVPESGLTLLDSVIKPHDKDFILLGLYFLEQFAVSFDLEGEKIFFKSKSLAEED